MKKILFLLGLLLLLFFVGLYIMSNSVPKEFHVKREIDVNASSGFVFGSIASLEQMQLWSPWADLDPNMKTKILGNDGYAGAILEWSGNEKVGRGEQKLIRKYPFQRIETHYTYYEPHKSEMDSYIEMGTQYGTTHVIWGFTGTNNLKDRIYMAFTGNTMEELLGKDMEKGLENLKDMSQKRLFKAENDRLVREQKKAEEEATTESK